VPNLTHPATDLAVERDQILIYASQRQPYHILSYIDQIVGNEATPDVEFRFFEGKLPHADMDVIHLHRSTVLFGKGSRWKRLAKLADFVLQAKRHKIAVVRTLSGADASGKGVTLIPHAHYRERFLGYPRSAQVPGRLLRIAPVLPKGVAPSLSNFFLTETPGLTLRVVGKPLSGAYIGLKGMAARDPERVTLLLETISDGSTVQEVTAAELVLLPKVAEIEDMQVLYLALSLDRPVLAPATDLTRRLADKVGAGWITLYEGPLTAEAIDSAVTSLRATPPSGSPQLDGPDLEGTAKMYAKVFREAAAAGRR
jgi:beta-1,4-mannosyltransferase